MKNYSESYEELNEKQRLAVDSIDGPVLVLAGPGTGKTQLLSVRALSILNKKKIQPEEILILTYTNAAVKAMKERLASVIGLEGYNVEVGTFHSFANSIIQESEEAANYVGDKVQMNEVEKVRELEYILNNTEGIEAIRPHRAPYTYLREIAKRIGELKRDGIAPGDLRDYMTSRKNNIPLEEKYIERLRAFSIAYDQYEKLKDGNNKAIFDERGRYDFDDMILFATEALKKEPLLRKKYQEQFRYIMVDEYQDTNGAQIDMLFTICDRRDSNLCCVGDDDQSIYRFQGASVGNFKLLKERFPAIKELSLVDNYRSSKELIDISSSIISLIPLKERAGEKALNAVKKYKEMEAEVREFTTEDEEVLYLVDRIKALKDKIKASQDLSSEERSRPYNNIAILVRKRKDIAKIVDAFLQAGIPYATGEMDGEEDISGEKRVKQLLDVLELASTNPGEPEERDLALYKVLSADYMRIPRADLFNFIHRVNIKKEKDRRAGLFDEFINSEKTFGDAAKAVSGLFNDPQTRPVHAILTEFIKESGMLKFILEEYIDKDILRIRDLRALSSFINMVKRSDLAEPGIRLKDFMQEMKTRKDHDLSIPGKLVTMTQDGVRILTAHGSKGQEFYTVIIPFCLQNKNWPARPIPDKIPLPSDIFKARVAPKDKSATKQLYLDDETRLFYVAMTRAKSRIIFTSSPRENAISSAYLSRLNIEKTRSPYAEESILEKSLTATKLKEPFIGTERVLKDMIQNMTLNPTRLNNYISCRRKFFYNDVLKLPGSKKNSLVFGNCVHKALEDTYNEFLKTKAFPDFKFFRKSFEDALKFQGAGKVIEKECTRPERIKKLKAWFDIASKKPVIPLSLEKKLLVTVGNGIIFTGKYDKVEWEDQKRGLVRIVDYKTGKPDDHLKAIDLCDDLASDECDPYLRQLVAYKLLFEKDKRESKGKEVSHGALVFIEPVSKDMGKTGYKKDEYATKIVEIPEHMVQEIEKIIIATWDNIRKLHFDKLKKQDDDKCGKCDFQSICWG